MASLFNSTNIKAAGCGLANELQSVGSVIGRMERGVVKTTFDCALRREEHLRGVSSRNCAYLGLGSERPQNAT
jgi:hypothetical protein